MSAQLVCDGVRQIPARGPIHPEIGVRTRSGLPCCRQRPEPSHASHGMIGQVFRRSLSSTPRRHQTRDPLRPRRSADKCPPPTPSVTVSIAKFGHPVRQRTVPEPPGAKPSIVFALFVATSPGPPAHGLSQRHRLAWACPIRLTFSTARNRLIFYGLNSTRPQHGNSLFASTLPDTGFNA